jgi:hypothetical protein
VLTELLKAVFGIPEDFSPEMVIFSIISGPIPFDTLYDVLFMIFVKKTLFGPNNYIRCLLYILCGLDVFKVCAFYLCPLAAPSSSSSSSSSSAAGPAFAFLVGAALRAVAA